MIRCLQVVVVVTFLRAVLGDLALAQVTAPRESAYSIPADALRDLALLKAFGLMPAGTKEDDFGRMGKVQVAEGWTVTGVPIEFLYRSADAALMQATAVGLLPEYAEGEKLPQALENRTLDRRAAAKGLVAWWGAEILAQWGPSFGKPPAEYAVKHDARWDGELKTSNAAPPRPLSARWLLDPPGLESSFSPTRQVRKPVSFRMLLERFNPEAPVTEDTAPVVAEELVWTYRLNLSDGRLGTLPEARRMLQALLLEQLGFAIGDPLDADAAKRKAAGENLAAAMRVCGDAWKAADAAK